MGYAGAMLKRDYPTQYCPVASTLEVIGERWTLLIIRDVFLGIRRFEDLQRDLGVARNILQVRLERLVEEGILVKRPYQERPLRSEYRLTEKGADLWPVLVAMLQWGDRHALEGERPDDPAAPRLRWRARRPPPLPLLWRGRLGDRGRGRPDGGTAPAGRHRDCNAAGGRPARPSRLSARARRRPHRYRAAHERRHGMAGRDGTGGAGPHQGGVAVRTGRGGDHPHREAQPASRTR